MKKALSWLQAHRLNLAVFILYVFLAIGMTWPLASRLTTHLPGNGGDLWSHWWNFWWLKRTLLHGETPFYTHYLFFPQGASLVYHNFAWVHFFAWLPLQAIVGPIAAYGLITLLAFALSGYTMFLLVRKLTSDSLAAAVAGVIYAFWPYSQSQFDHVMRVVPWFPLLLLCLEQVMRRTGFRNIMRLALVIALVGLTFWHFLTFGVIIVGLYIIYSWLIRPDTRSWRPIARVGAAWLIAVLLVSPLIAPFLLDLASGNVAPETIIDEQTWAQTDLVAYLLPNRFHPVWKEAVWHWYDRLIVNKVYIAFTGYTTLGLALFGLIYARRRALFWILLALVFFLLALGPVLRVNGMRFQWIPMPYRLVEDIFFVRALRKPDRFNLVLGLPIGVLAGWGIVGLRHRVSSRSISAIIVIMLSALILFEYLMVPFPTVRPKVPQWYKTLSRELGQFGILDLPIDRYVFDKKYVLYQTTHGKPLVGGHVSRLSFDALSFINESPFLRTLYQEHKMDPSLVDVSRQLEYLGEHNIRYLILHKAHAGDERLARWQDWLTIEPAHEDADLVVYRTQPQLGRDFHFVHQVSPALGLIQITAVPTSTTQEGLITVDARWGSAAPPRRTLDVQLDLVTPDGEIAQSVRLPLSPEWSTDQWSANAVVRAQYPMRIDPFISSGVLHLHLTLIDQHLDTSLGETVTVGMITVTSQPRVFDSPPLEHHLDVTFGDEMDLLGHDLRQDDENIHLILYWKALRRMDTRYKIFVHLLDSTTNVLVAQDDAMPRRWTYPTTWWEAGEVVSDEISLSLEEVPSGQYDLMVGVYHPDTGERLPISSPSSEGVTFINDAIILSELTIP
jgi:hypothetical protein